MGIKTLLARRRSENRIQRRTRAANKPQVDPDTQLDKIVEKYGDRAYNVGNRLFNTTQARKAEGKVILKHWLKHGVGTTYRTVMGPRLKQPPKRRKK